MSRSRPRYGARSFRVNLPGVMLGLVSADFFAFCVLRAPTLARRLNNWTVLLLGAAVIVAGIITAQAGRDHPEFTAPKIE